ncbi:MerR family transcriptional regulator [Alteromonas mediterranea]|jgi:DNA-binding transcriptional MerR regulator|uniref:MerR family transcriptional regulator n=2 Tax=Alteromonas mediterranea TaxID=314275 RepID=A0AAC8XKK9_9ALTE|nr:helix-turn-helix domain-containing protein [Alteromonas mediterranea]AGP94147.1 merR family transcriptional regulator [Alteromonas mediterranea U8]MBR9782819.1 helix-turn-helix domain-containing protein [Gammaproteobacteria bacterium]MEA3381804.1 helix-turn-helix domain-containing protein [Pseudomonadota bacterium]AEA98537.1 MerR family transcriptional regulator [Alteromonas mediterranea DE]AFV86051.1 transcriptional regulator, MerR family protein [Alteromonas mediterranea DE1]|tara:strand:+ start:852 stop:1265 length:414 start_codon:yes stop_codon:yes gene_type:complete
MEISQVAKKSGVSASTLRFYEEKGLITSIGRQGIRRVFSPNVLERLELIALGRAAGFSLEEIAGILGNEAKPEINRELLLRKANELDRTIKKLTAMRDGLKHAAACTAPSHLECPRFRRLMNLAGTGAIKGLATSKK